MKIITVTFGITALLLAGCGSVKPVNTNTIQTNTVNYVCPSDMDFRVDYSENQAILKDASDRVFTLKQMPSGSGSFYTNEQGVSIHEKGREAIITLVKNKPIICKIFKPN